MCCGRNFVSTYSLERSLEMMSFNGAHLRRTTELFQVSEGLVWSSLEVILRPSKKFQYLLCFRSHAW